MVPEFISQVLDSPAFVAIDIYLVEECSLQSNPLYLFFAIEMSIAQIDLYFLGVSMEKKTAERNGESDQGQRLPSLHFTKIRNTETSIVTPSYN